MAIPQSFIQELLARADVVDIVGRYVQLKKGGANYMGLCPFHGEKSPSFSVSPTKQFFHCFGCGKNGNAIGFLMEHVGMNFVEAVKDLAQTYGMPVPQDDTSPQERERAAQAQARQASLSDVLEKAASAYRKHLKASPAAIEYLKGRGLTGEVALQYGLGYAPDGWRPLASTFADYQDALLVDSGLVIHHAEDGGEDKRYDRFRDRIMFPIRNIKGECIGFGGRVLGEGTPKYLNSPETPVFSKGRELYGLFEARASLRQAGYVLVTEGYMDVVALAQWGFAHAVATLGTACTSEHVQKLFRFSDAVVFAFDGDAAGRRAARKALDVALPFATDVRSVKFLFLPAEHDPDSYIRQFGPEAFARSVSDATPLSRFLIDAAREGCDLGSAEGRAHLASNAKPLWLSLPDGALKRQLLAEFADLIQLGLHELQSLWHPPSPASAKWQRRTPADGQLPQAGSPGTGFSRRFSSDKPARGLGRQLPASRADHALRLLLSDMRQWQDLSGEDHQMLCELPAPHGQLFTWLDSQYQEHGSLPWGALREGLRDHPCEALALKVMDTAFTAQTATQDEKTDPKAPSPQALASESAAELKALLNRLLIERLKAQETQAIASAQTDPSALARYRALQARRRSLENPPEV